MIHWLLAAGLLATGTYHNAKGYSGAVRIDFGRVIPGHSYYYKTYFRNDAGVPLRLTGGGAGCGSCPQLTAGGGMLAPGDSTELGFSVLVKKGMTDSAGYEVLLYTDDGSRRGLWVYRVSYQARRPALARAPARPIEMTPNGEGYLEGSIPLTSRSKQALLVSAAGLPQGVRFGTPLPLRLEPGSAARLVFWAPPELFTRHRSITLELAAVSGGVAQRLSLPMAP
jgi:hypothetical protein